MLWSCAGLGAGAGATLFGELARTTKKELRTIVFSVFMGMRQIGLVLGELRKCLEAEVSRECCAGHLWRVGLVISGGCGWSLVEGMADRLWRVWLVVCGGCGWSFVEGGAGHLWRVWLVVCGGCGWLFVVGVAGHLWKVWLVVCGGLGWSLVEGVARLWRIGLVTCGGCGWSLMEVWLVILGW